jgi:hypothetical protein
VNIRGEVLRKIDRKGQKAGGRGIKERKERRGDKRLIIEKLELEVVKRTEG